MEIFVRIKHVYGKELIYPVGGVASTICRIAGKKTLSRQDIDNLKQVGFTISVEAPTL